MILAFETATNVCSVAFMDSEGAVFEKRTEQRGAHSEQLFLFVEELMEEHQFRIPDLEAVLISGGPGSYTGLRIGASAIKGLLFQQQIPLYAVNTLASFAMQAAGRTEGPGRIHSIIDARRKHFYYRHFRYEEGRLSAGTEVQVIPINEFEKRVEAGDIIVGTGLDRMGQGVREEAEVMGISSVTAASLIAVYREQRHFLQEMDPQSFSPEYYSSNQVS